MTNEEFIQSIALEGEEWKTIPNWERYAVSSFGRIAALAKVLQIPPSVIMGWENSTKDPNSFYIDPETAALAQTIHDNPELRILMDASKDLSPEDVKFVADLVQRMKRKESGEIE